MEASPRLAISISDGFHRVAFRLSPQNEAFLFEGSVDMLQIFKGLECLLLLSSHTLTVESIMGYLLTTSESSTSLLGHIFELDVLNVIATNSLSSSNIQLFLQVCCCIYPCRLSKASILSPSGSGDQNSGFVDISQSSIEMPAGSIWSLLLLSELLCAEALIIECKRQLAQLMTTESSFSALLSCLKSSSTLEGNSLDLPTSDHVKNKLVQHLLKYGVNTHNVNTHKTQTFEAQSTQSTSVDATPERRSYHSVVAPIPQMHVQIGSHSLHVPAHPPQPSQLPPYQQHHSDTKGFSTGGSPTSIAFHLDELTTNSSQPVAPSATGDQPSNRRLEGASRPPQPELINQAASQPRYAPKRDQTIHHSDKIVMNGQIPKALQSQQQPSPEQIMPPNPSITPASDAPLPYNAAPINNTNDKAHNRRREETSLLRTSSSRSMRDSRDAHDMELHNRERSSSKPRWRSPSATAANAARLPATYGIDSKYEQDRNVSPQKGTGLSHADLELSREVARLRLQHVQIQQALQRSQLQAQQALKQQSLQSLALKTAVLRVARSGGSHRPQESGRQSTRGSTPLRSRQAMSSASARTSAELSLEEEAIVLEEARRRARLRIRNHTAMQQQSLTQSSQNKPQTTIMTSGNEANESSAKLPISSSSSSAKASVASTQASTPSDPRRQTTPSQPPRAKTPTVRSPAVSAAITTLLQSADELYWPSSEATTNKANAAATSGVLSSSKHVTSSEKASAGATQPSPQQVIRAKTPITSTNRSIYSAAALSAVGRGASPNTIARPSGVATATGPQQPKKSAMAQQLLRSSNNAPSAPSSSSSSSLSSSGTAGKEQVSNRQNSTTRAMAGDLIVSSVPPSTIAPAMRNHKPFAASSTASSSSGTSRDKKISSSTASSSRVLAEDADVVNYQDAEDAVDGAFEEMLLGYSTHHQLPTTERYDGTAVDYTEEEHMVLEVTVLRAWELPECLGGTHPYVLVSLQQQRSGPSGVSQPVFPIPLPTSLRTSTKHHSTQPEFLSTHYLALLPSLSHHNGDVHYEGKVSVSAFSQHVSVGDELLGTSEIALSELLPAQSLPQRQQQQLARSLGPTVTPVYLQDMYGANVGCVEVAVQVVSLSAVLALGLV